MVAAGYIDQATADQSAAVDIHGQLVDAYEGKSEDYRYPSYFDAVINEAVNEYGLTEEDIVKKWLPDLHRAGSKLPSKHAGDL